MSDAFERFKIVASNNLGGDERNWSLLQAALGACSESGEFAQVVRKWFFERARSMTPAKMEAAACDELADVMAYVAYAARQLDVSMDRLLALYLQKRADRLADLVGGREPEEVINVGSEGSDA